MTAYVEYAAVLVDARYAFEYLPAEQSEFSCKIDLRDATLGMNGILKFRENPRCTDGSASDKYAVDTVSVERLAGFLGRGDVAVADKRDVEARIVFDACDFLPVGLACVHLRARASVDGECLYAAVLKLLGKVDNDLAVAVPSEACLDSDRKIDGFDYGTCDLKHFGHVAQESGSGSFPGDFLDRASEVYVDEIGACLGCHACCLGHRLGLTSVDLYGGGTFGPVDRQLA